jgi:LuxR family maltose regulon positive regulatory protein
VLDRPPAEVRRLLLRTSVLERMSGPLADYLTEGSGSERILLGLERDDERVALFDVGRSWFRYHHLFADLLRPRAATHRPRRDRAAAPGRRPVVRRAGFIVDAITHAQAAGDRRQAARLLFDHMVGLALDGRGTRSARCSPPSRPTHPLRIRSWRRSLPAPSSNAGLSRRRCRTQPPRSGRPRRSPTSDAATSTSTSASCGSPSLAGAAISPLCSTRCTPWKPRQRRERPAKVAFGNDIRAATLMDLGVAELWSFRVDDARRHLEQGAALARRIGRPWVEIACLGHMAVEAGERSVALARKESEQAIAIAETHGLGSNPILAMALVVFGGALASMGRFEEAERWLDREVLYPEAEPATGAMVLHRKGMLRAGQGRLGEALTAFRAAEKLVLASQPFLVVQLRGALLQTQVRLGENERRRGGARRHRRGRAQSRRAARRRGRHPPRGG